MTFSRQKPYTSEMRSDLVEQLIEKDIAFKMPQEKIFNLKIRSQFIPTPTAIKEKLGVGYKVLAIEMEREQPNREITDVNSAFEAILFLGYRALARANHPDLGGDHEKMVIINRAKKEMTELLESFQTT